MHEIDVSIENSLCPRCHRKMNITVEDVRQILLEGKAIKKRCACGMSCTLAENMEANA